MKAMVFDRVGEPLHLMEMPRPRPLSGQVQVRVEACGVCRTDLHVLAGDLRSPKLPLVLGHEIVGIVTETGQGVQGIEPGQRVGIPWVGHTCGVCPFCASGRENLCDNARFTGYQVDGGYAEYAVADHRYCFPIPAAYDSAQAAPLLCAGLIGYRSLRMTAHAGRLGLYGFGAAAHIVIQIARYQGREVFAFTRPGDTARQEFARTLGADWAGDSDALPPQRLDAAIIFAPVGALVPLALRAVVKGGTVVCAGIHMDPIPTFSYDLLWEERTVRSVANLTRRDAIEFFDIAPRVPVRTEIESFPLSAANEALRRLEAGELRGAAVLVVAGA